MSGQERRTHIETRGMKLDRELSQRLRCIPKTMQEENSSRIPLLQIDRFRAFSYDLLSRLHPVG